MAGREGCVLEGWWVASGLHGRRRKTAQGRGRRELGGLATGGRDMA